jgi:carboxymethylenebutenolidase
MTISQQTVQLQALDGGSISALHLEPEARSRSGVILVQEVFGVTASMREVALGFARDGYDTLAPAFFDRIAPGIELLADADGMRQGRAHVATLGMDAPLRDVRAAADFLLARGCTRVGVVGYCWGGSLAFLCATRLGLPAASYYGRLIPQYLHERPQAPLIFHFGELDELIPEDSIRAVERALPALPVYRYRAGHAFNRVGDPHYHVDSARLARERTLAFLGTA